MKVSIKYSSIFYTKVKKFLKKFPTLGVELQQPEAAILLDPTMGEALGKGLYKIRLASKIKAKAKSGGFRVINYLVNKERDEFFVTVVTIYDKSEESNIKKEALLKMLDSLED
jgi:hypothetical protein